MVLLDYSRILLFHRTTESAAMLSIQSVLSAYDEQIYKKYGLFGRGGTDSKELFQRSIAANHEAIISPFSMQKAFDLATVAVGESSIITDHYLGEHDVFARQVLEEMKYKAPIEFTLEFVEKWLPLSDAVSQAENMMDAMNRLEDLFLEREQLLENALELQQLLSNQLQVSNYYSYATSKLNGVVNGYSGYLGWIKDKAEIIRQLDDQTLSEEDRAELENKKVRYETQISSYLNSFHQLENFSNLYQGELKTTSEQLVNSIISNIETSSALNHTIKIQYELYLNMEKQNNGSGDELSELLGSLTFDEEGLVREEQFFKDYKAAIQKHQIDLVTYINHTQEVINQLSTSINTPSSHSNSSAKQAQLNQLLTQNESLLKQYELDYYSPGTIVAYWREQVTSTKQIKEQMMKDEQMFKEELSGLASITDLLQNKEKLAEYRDSYKELEQLYSTNYRINQDSDEDHISGSDIDQSTGRIQAQAATSQLKSLLGMMDNNFSVSARDHVYISEYILNRYEHFPMGKLENNEATLDADLLDYSNQEVEFIIYGVFEPLENVLLAFGEIFAFRFAIRTIEGLIANRALGNPLLIFSAAVLQGVRGAFLDMKQLINKGYTELSKYVPIQIDYSQYLRLFLFVHAGGKEKRLSRMIAIIEKKLSITLLSVPTAITGQVTTSMRLLSLPGIANVVGAMLPMESRIRGDIYEKTDIVAVSY